MRESAAERKPSKNPSKNGSVRWRSAASWRISGVADDRLISCGIPREPAASTPSYRGRGVLRGSYRSLSRGVIMRISPRRPNSLNSGCERMRILFTLLPRPRRRLFLLTQPSSSASTSFSVAARFAAAARTLSATLTDRRLVVAPRTPSPESLARSPLTPSPSIPSPTAVVAAVDTIVARVHTVVTVFPRRHNSLLPFPVKVSVRPRRAVPSTPFARVDRNAREKREPSSVVAPAIGLAV